MNKLFELINRIDNDPNCIVREYVKIPLVPDSLELPDDLKLFYENYGGIIFYPEKEYPIEIVIPDQFVRANPIIVGEPCEYDISYDWFIIAKSGDSQFITIDLAKKRLGKCYDSFLDRHGLVGDMPIIANSFTELIDSLYNNKGEYWYWLKEDFIYLGDAYDNK